MSMELAYMLNQMCHTGLSSADISAIRKERGFSAKEATSRATFENFYLSSIGLEAVMTSLLPEEVAGLHLLTQQDEEVDITFFERLYGSAKKGEDYYYSRTFTQQYKGTLDAVKKSLVRKGILVIAEAKTRSESVQMERWRFRFPPQFAEFLPPIIPSPHVADAPGQVKVDVARTKLLEVLGDPPVSTPNKPKIFAVTVEHGSLKTGDHDFQASDLAAFQQASWWASLGAAPPKNPATLSPVKAVQTVLETLAPREWAAPEQLEVALKVFCYGVKIPPTAKICEEGWKWGCLAQLVESHKTYYRLPPSGEGAQVSNPEPSAYLKLHPSGSSVIIDLHTIPFDTLEHLNRLARLELARSNDAAKLLIALPDSIKLGRTSPEDRRSPLADWLSTHSPEFQQAIEAVNSHWGKTILHRGLLVARVRDLSLRVQLERDLGEYLLVLSDEYVAFPRGWRGEVEKTLKKGGFVIKEVRA